MMATYFGEVLEPTSRAIFEEFSDDEEEVKPIEFRLCWFEPKEIIPTVFDTVFLFHGKLSVVFAEAYLTSEFSVPIGEIIATDNNEADEENLACHKPKLLPSRIYIENKTVKCLISPTYSSDRAFLFAECISEILKEAKRIVLFTDESPSNYRAQFSKDLPPAFVRELKTSHSKSAYIAKELPVPNLVSGIPAAVASWCQINKKDASLFVCYVDQQKLDSVTASPYLAVIRKIYPDLIKNDYPDFTKKKFYGTPDVIGGSSNIYM